MRISDWSSDVCSSDLAEQGEEFVTRRGKADRLDSNRIIVNLDDILEPDELIGVAGPWVCSRSTVQHGSGPVNNYSRRSRSSLKAITTRLQLSPHAGLQTQAGKGLRQNEIKDIKSEEARGGTEGGSKG